MATDLSGQVVVTEAPSNRLAVFRADGGLVRERRGLSKPVAVAVSSDGRILVANAGRGNVEVRGGDLSLLHKLGSGDGEFGFPTGIALDGSGTVYVSDGMQDRIKVYDGHGAFLHSIGSRGDGDGQLRFPTALAVDEALGEVVVADLPAGPQGSPGARIQVFSCSGAFRRRFGSFGIGDGLLVKPLGIALDGTGRIFVSDAYLNVVQAFDGGGGFLFRISDGSHPLRTPIGLSVGRRDGRLYVASLNTATVEVFESGGSGGGMGGDGGRATLTFGREGGSCSVGGASSRESPSVGGAIAVLLPALWIAGRRARFPRRRPWIVVPVLALGATGIPAHALDPPSLRGPAPLSTDPRTYTHYPHVDTHLARACEACHVGGWTEGYLLPAWAVHAPVDPDDTPHNNLCRSCHNTVTAPFAKTHSSLTTDQRYGAWTVECRTCHAPHFHSQFFTYGSAARILEGTVLSVTDNALTATVGGWAENAYRGLIVVPNPQAYYSAYRIDRNDGNTLFVSGPMDPDQVSPGSPFAITYGKLIRATIRVPSGEWKAVRLFRGSGANSLADGDATYDGVCEVCHTQTACFRGSAPGNGMHRAGERCTQCHSHATGFKTAAGGSHAPHLPLLSCESGSQGCHGANDPPLLGDGQNLQNTGTCNNCHTASGAANAKTYWSDGTGAWTAAQTERQYCGSCHKAGSQGNSRMDGTGDPAQPVMGDDATCGFAVTGHGRPSGNYGRLSWQDTAAIGNPAANLQCSGCHDLSSAHYNATGKRLKAGFEDDASNANCRRCHDPGTTAGAAPQWYTTYTAFQSSAHAAIKCSVCHDVHGRGAYPGMTRFNRQALCLSAGCHTGMSGHAIGTAFGRGGLAYSLECVSCHNVHAVTGRITAADPAKSPLTRPSANTGVWGDDPSEKMSAYAGSGTYRTPKGDALTGVQLPDYPTFCLDCHGVSMSPSIHGDISWGEMHGTAAAGPPSEGGTCPDWYGCGEAKGWEGDSCTGGDNVCWPVISRGAGETLWTRDSYVQTERIANINFVLSCSDCHVTHESGIGKKLRATINGNPGSTDYGTLCNACHWHYGVNHAGKSCGNAGCHNANENPRPLIGGSYNTLHGQSSGGGGGGARTFDNTLVVDMRFENNLNDSGSWRMHGTWRVSAGSYAAGRFGQSIDVSDDPVEVGTRNSYWSTDEGNHGTWKHTEMKYRMTLEAWVYPTDGNGNERRILAKSYYYDGGYSLVLRKVNGAWRAGLLVKTNGARNDYRGAYSSTSVPLSEWTHIAATYDHTGLDRNPVEGSVGRIRIYVNGEDVTASDTSGSYIQPGPGENAMFPYSMHNAAPAGICYNDSWCASPLSIGGVNWSDNASNFIGRIDEVKVWNVTKDAAYFQAVDGQTAPRIDRVDGVVGTNTLSVTFSEGVYASAGGAGALQPSDFVLADADNGRSIAGVTHTAGGYAAVLTLSSALDGSNDLGTDTLAAAANAIYDNYGNPAATTPVVLSWISSCPTGQIVFDLDEPAGSAFILDDQQLLCGAVNDPSDTMGSGAFFGDNVNNYISFQNNTSCMKATTALTLEARIRPTSMAGTGNYIARIFAKDTGVNYQMSVWRNNTVYAPNYNAPAGTASIAFWVAVDNTHGGNAWKVALTNYTTCPIVSDHWYVVKTVWDSNKPGGVPGQKFVPADVFIEDQGTDGYGAGRNWAGSLNCTKADQSYLPDNAALYTGDTIKQADGVFAVGCSAGTLGNNKFIGSIDWITWYGSAGAPPQAPSRQMDLELFLPAP